MKGFWFATVILLSITGILWSITGILLSITGSRLSVAAELSGEAPPQRPITADERDHWAYRPIFAAPLPAVAGQRWSRHPVDRFLKAAMVRQSIEPLPRSSKSTLMRRVFFDLTGLPPAPREVIEFLNDDSADAYEKLVEGLLSSPAYGERWAQHWLDVARFAETDGFEHDLIRPNAWRYRDWVIDALNKDMPFDEFLRRQLAGDELLPGDPDAAVATGFLLCGPDMPDLNLQEERRNLILNEMTATVGSVFLGMQFGCAQCHDHKFDPIRQYDFYRLRAFFESADLFRDHPIPTADELAARRLAEEASNPEDRRRAHRRQELENLGKDHFREKNPDVQPTLKQWLGELSEADRNEHSALVKALASAARLPELPLGRVLRDGVPRPSHLYLRGDFRQVGPVVNCGFPHVLEPVAADLPDPFEKPRAKLAAWLTRPGHPLTARVIVNRLWQWHFGVGLCASSSDFGVMGGEPTHPELLDWLAQRFTSDGWSIKKMHRLLVTSEAYQTATSPFDHAWSPEQSKAAQDVWHRSYAKDPQNDLLWHRRRWRLEGETIRDAMLSASGQLSPRRGGPGVRAPLPPEVTVTLLKDQWVVTGGDDDHRRRSIYLFVRRNLRYPMFDVFDRPDTNASCALRHESTTVTQSLVLLNSEFSLHCARWLASALIRSEPESPARQIEAAYVRVYSRQATPDEVRLGQEFLDQQQKLLRSNQRTIESLVLPEGPTDRENPWASAALVDFCLALFNTNEFVYLD